MGYRSVLYALLSLALCGCDLLTGARASATPSGQLGVPTTAARESPSASASPGVGTGLPSALASTLVSLVPSPSLRVPSPSASPPIALPPAFTPTVAPTVGRPAIAPPSILPSPTLARATITSFTPEFGLRGSLVLINGTGLAGTRLVLFGDVAVAPTGPTTDAQVNVIVPQEAVTSRISVVTPAGVTTSTRFFTVIESDPAPSPSCPVRVQCLPAPPPTTTP